MVRSLREQYEKKMHIIELRERVSRVDEQLLAEERATQLLMEAMDNDDLRKVSMIIDMLNRIKSPEMPVLNDAIEQAQTELNRYTAGGPIAKAWHKLRNVAGLQNPITKILTFTDALQMGFQQIPQILRNNGVDIQSLQKNDVKLNQSLATYIGNNAKKPVEKKPGQKSDEEMGKSPFTGKNVPNNEPINVPNPHEAKQTSGQTLNEEVLDKRLQAIAKQLTTALSPKGIYGVFKKVPYIKNMQELVNELLNVPLKVFRNVYDAIQSGPQAKNLGQDAKNIILNQNNTQTQQPQQGQQTKSSSPSQQASPPPDSTNEPAHTVSGEEKPPQPRGGGAAPKNPAAQVYNDLKADLGGLDQNTVQKVLNLLAKKGKLKV